MCASSCRRPKLRRVRPPGCPVFTTCGSISGEHPQVYSGTQHPPPLSHGGFQRTQYSNPVARGGRPPGRTWPRKIPPGGLRCRKPPSGLHLSGFFSHTSLSEMGFASDPEPVETPGETAETESLWNQALSLEPGSSTYPGYPSLLQIDPRTHKEGRLHADGSDPHESRGGGGEGCKVCPGRVSLIRPF